MTCNSFFFGYIIIVFGETIKKEKGDIKILLFEMGKQEREMWTWTDHQTSAELFALERSGKFPVFFRCDDNSVFPYDYNFHIHLTPQICYRIFIFQIQQISGGIT